MSLLHSLSTSGCQAHLVRDVCSESRAAGCCTTEHMLGVTCGVECHAKSQTNTHYSVAVSSFHNTDSFSYIPARPDGEVCFVEDYFDDNTECLTRETVSLHNVSPGVAFGAAEIRGMEDRGVTEIVATVSSMSTRSSGHMLAEGETCHDGCYGVGNTEVVNGGSGDNDDDEEDDDDGSHFGTSMLQNKKKPRSRLKKFLTSLLSLSSSSSDDDNYDNRPAPSQPSNW